jgi:hypothetical protein
VRRRVACQPFAHVGERQEALIREQPHKHAPPVGASPPQTWTHYVGVEPAPFHYGNGSGAFGAVYHGSTFKNNGVKCAQPTDTCVSLSSCNVGCVGCAGNGVGYGRCASSNGRGAGNAAVRGERLPTHQSFRHTYVRGDTQHRRRGVATPSSKHLHARSTFEEESFADPFTHGGMQGGIPGSLTFDATRDTRGMRVHGMWNEALMTHSTAHSQAPPPPPPPPPFHSSRLVRHLPFDSGFNAGGGPQAPLYSHSHYDIANGIAFDGFGGGPSSASVSPAYSSNLRSGKRVQYVRPQSAPVASGGYY